MSKEGTIVIRCKRTGNPWGTDTLPEGTQCGCEICEAVKFGRNTTDADKSLVKEYGGIRWYAYTRHLSDK